MAPPCPVIDPLRPPTLPRDLPNLLLFAATCLPGTGTATGCATNQMFYSVLIPWPNVVSDTPQAGRSWTAPGGNRYWADQTRENTPAGLAMLRLMAEVSRKHFQRTFQQDDYKNLTMAQVLERYAGKLAVSDGIVYVEKRPDPNETAGNFARRGGYLLWIDPASGPFRGRQPLDGYRPSWVPFEITAIQLWAYYNAATKTVEYNVRVVFKGTWQKIATGIMEGAGFLLQQQRKLCEVITGEDAQKAQMAAEIYQRNREAAAKAETTNTGTPAGPPPTSPYEAAWAATVAVCRQGLQTWNAPPVPEHCLPPKPVATPTYGWKSQTAVATSGGAASTVGVLATQPAYPPGSIAYVDPTAQLVLVAVPQPGKGTTHALQSSLPFMNGQPYVPTSLFQVTREQWERATLPWIKRRSTKIGAIGIAIIGATATATAIVRHQP